MQIGELRVVAIAVEGLLRGPLDEDEHLPGSIPGDQGQDVGGTLIDEIAVALTGQDTDIIGLSIADQQVQDAVPVEVAERDAQRLRVRPA